MIVVRNIPSLVCATLLVGMAIWMGCAQPVTAASGGENALGERGMIYRLSPESDIFTIIPASDPHVRYCPYQLPAGFRVDSMWVIFSGEILPVPENVRLAGTPLLLTMIQRE